MVCENMLDSCSIDERIASLLDSIHNYLNRFDPFNDRLYGILNTIKANLVKLDSVDDNVKNNYLLNTLNYLEKLNHSYLWRYNIAS